MQVSDLMQRINFTMPKFKDHEKGNFISFSTTETEKGLKTRTENFW